MTQPNGYNQPEVPQKSQHPSMDELNMSVTEGIFRAESLERDNPGEAPDAWASVSDIEAEIAVLQPPENFEGEHARRGAVRAAIKSGNMERARSLAQGFLAEEGITVDQKTQIEALFSEEQ